MWLIMWISTYWSLSTVTAECSAGLHGLPWDPVDETMLQTTTALLGSLIHRCGIPLYLPPKEFYHSELSWKVELSFQPLQVVDVDEIEQSVTLSSYLILMWTDSSLSWDPKHFRGIDMIQMKQSDIWTPTVIVPKTTQSTGVKLQLPDKVSVTSDGLVTVPVPQFISTLCEFDMRDFPFDSHRCSIVFLEQEFFLNMTAFESETSDVKTYFGTNAGWLLEEEGCFSRLSNSSQFPTITYVICHVRLNRRSAFYVINLIGPMALTSVMTLIVFWIPPEEREKVSFVTSVFMSTSLYLGFILDRLPRSMDTVPYLNLLLMAIVAEVILATIATAFVLQYSRGRSNPHSQATEEKSQDESFPVNLETGLFKSDYQRNTETVLKTGQGKTAPAEESEATIDNEDNLRPNSPVTNIVNYVKQHNAWDSASAQNQNQNQSSCCSILSCGLSKVDGSEDEATKKPCDPSFEDKLRDFSKLPRILLNQNKVNDAIQMENGLKQSNTDKTFQNMRRPKAFSLKRLRSRFFFNIPLSDDGPKSRFGNHQEKEHQQRNRSPKGNVLAKFLIKRKSIVSEKSPKGYNDARCPPVGERLPDKEEDHSRVPILCRLLRKDRDLEPADFDRLFFWIMLVLKVVTWLAFLLPTRF